jgi:hypothetical protein
MPSTPTRCKDHCERYSLQVLPTGLRARASQRRIPAMPAVVAQVGIRLQLERDEPVALKGQAA